MKSLVIRAIELPELAQLGSALMISASEGSVFSEEDGRMEFMKREIDERTEGPVRP